MKPFNLEEAKAGKPIITRDGNPAKFLAHAPEAKNPMARLVVLTEESMVLYCENGSYIDENSQSNFDLFMAPNTKTVWANFYGSGTAYFYDTQQKADEKAGVMWKRLGGKAVKVEIEL